MNGLVFLDADRWPILVGLCVALGFGVWLQRRQARHAARQLGSRARALAGERVGGFARAVLGGAAVLLCGLALLRPAGAGRDGQDGADVVVCVDVSWSMAARDSRPSRLQAVQQAIATLAANAGASRLGLVVFAGEAQLLVPLTHDHAAVAAMAQDLWPGAHGTAGTDPGAAIGLAQRALAVAGSGAIVLCSDGEDPVGGGATAAATAAAAGMAVHVLACGDDGGSKIPVPGERGETFLRTQDGTEIVTRRELDRLQALATAGGGRLVPVAEHALRELHDATVLPAARAAAVLAGRLQPVGLQAWPLCLAFLFWMLRACLPERRR
ncbi:MAG: VWA domain-containing protein [Planctomycetes bacterium]|nr:VWA domain-containing protein [Planctomycetota bacterium]